MKEKVVPKHKFWKEMFRYMKHYKKDAFLSVFGSAVTGIGVAVMPLVIKYIVDSGINNEPFFGHVIEGFDNSLIFVIVCACLYVVISLIRMTSWRIGIRHNLKVIEGALFELRSDLFDHVQHLCMRFYDTNPSGKVFSYIMGSPMTNIRTYINSVITQVPYQVIAFCISLFALVNYDWRLTIILFVTAFVMALVQRLARGHIRKASKEYIDSETETSSYVNDMIHGMDAVKIYSIENRTLSKFDGFLQKLKEKGIAYTLRVTMEQQKPEFINSCGTAVVYITGAIFCLKGEITVGVLYAFLSSMSSILSILTSWLNLGFTKNTAEASLDKIFTMMDEHTSTPEVEEENAHNIEEEKKKALSEGKPVIEFEHVAFAYDSKPIFSDFSCKINYNESVALVGASGSGKSTLTKLVLRLYETTNGAIKLHDVNIKDYPSHDLRDSFGVVPQSPYIFHDTIWNNISISNPDATDVEIRRAMHISRVDEFVYDLPEGAQTVIGDGAVALSGGQKQRIAIARAILKKTDFLIFDEATSALDNISEKYIQAAMDDLMKTHTVIIVAHRLSTIRNVDRILVFDNGQIVQEGKYDELASVPGVFSDMLHASEK